jgi:hypothetical protein
MTKQGKRAVKALAAEVQKSLDKHTNIGISASNYGLSASPDVLTELARLLPGVKMRSGGFMGYIHFERDEHAPQDAGGLL